MHRAGTILGRHVVAQQQRDLAFGIERVIQQHVLQRRALGVPMHHDFAHAVPRQRLGSQRFGDHQPARLAAIGRTFDQHIVQLRAQAHRQRRRQRPRRGGPDRHRHAHARRQARAERSSDRSRVARRIGDIHGRRHLVGVFDLGLGQRRTAIEAPVHRLDAAGQVAVIDHLGQRADFVGFEAEIQRLVWVVPIADHAQALEIAPLQIDLLGGVFAALLPKFGRIELDADLAVFFRSRSRSAGHGNPSPGYTVHRSRPDIST